MFTKSTNFHYKLSKISYVNQISRKTWLQWSYNRRMRQSSPEEPCETTPLLDSAAARLVKIVVLPEHSKIVSPSKSRVSKIVSLKYSPFPCCILHLQWGFLWQQHLLEAHSTLHLLWILLCLIWNICAHCCIPLFKKRLL